MFCFFFVTGNCMCLLQKLSFFLLLITQNGERDGDGLKFNLKVCK